MFENRVKTLLAESKAVWGVSLPDASDVVAKFSIDTGVDFMWVDLEHRPFEVDAVRWVRPLTNIFCMNNVTTDCFALSGLSSSGVLTPRATLSPLSRQALALG